MTMEPGAFGGKRGNARHLGQVRHRSKVVEYRVSLHKRMLGKRLAAVRRAPPFATRVFHGGTLPCNRVPKAGFEPTPSAPGAREPAGPLANGTQGGECPEPRSGRWRIN